MSKEIELKLRLLSDSGRVLYDHPTVHKYCQKDAMTVDTTSWYFDTDDYQLLKAGVALRVRYTEINGYIQTLKSAGTVTKGLHTRLEYDAPVNTNAIDLSVIEDQTMRQKVTKIASQASIKPLFTTLFARAQWDLHLSNDSRVELAWDQGEISVADHVMPINEIELELKQGEKTYALYELAADFAIALPLTLEKHSKAWYGYQLHQAVAEQRDYHDLRPDATPMSAEFFIAQAKQLKYHYN